MKSIVTSIMESLVKSKKISGSKFVKAESKEYGVEENIKSSNWNKSEFKYKGDDIVAYWTPDSSWIFYYHVKEKDALPAWGAVSTGNGVEYTEGMFNDFEDMLMDGATIPEFEVFDTNLE